MATATKKPHTVAERAALYAYDGAGSARFEPHVAEQHWPAAV
jgi:hypothetical protein